MSVGTNGATMEPEPSSSTPGVTLVDPRAPRFGQAVTATGLVLGIVLGEPLFVFAVTAVLVVSVLSGWRFDLYRVLWRRAAIPVVGPSADREPAAPHRFAKLLGAAFTAVASAALLAAPAVPVPALALAGYVAAGLVAALAALAATTDVCLGCTMYRQVSFFRRLGVV